jgi:hypothetical protein
MDAVDGLHRSLKVETRVRTPLGVQSKDHRHARFGSASGQSDLRYGMAPRPGPTAAMGAARGAAGRAACPQPAAAAPSNTTPATVAEADASSTYRTSSCVIRPLVSAREMTRRHRRCVAGQ